ncbi:hypothetical protein P7K49_009263, partial [Saguinus oedipus]
PNRQCTLIGGPLFMSEIKHSTGFQVVSCGPQAPGKGRQSCRALRSHGGPAAHHTMPTQLLLAPAGGNANDVQNPGTSASDPRDTLGDPGVHCCGDLY